MELFIKLPEDIQRGMFRFFRHPVAAAAAAEGEEWQRMVENIRNYHATLDVLNSFPRDHKGAFGRASLLNHLWMWGRNTTGTWHKIWERRKDINDEAEARRVVAVVARRGHTYQINMIWSLFTADERVRFLLYGWPI